ncbi:kinesin-like protein KIN-6 isoform X2 [Medicago truncatula]|uniref:Kinesin motor domain protein n=1 Tax=Medicago truncatula TaxID=3880 RepID=A0A072V332_MEDTR|nr:kinesin-like protein KIN-6 isoform X2 [Medicago truncatula]KEH36252.1 kinesin motor domain protein [Medicago truncatula]
MDTTTPKSCPYTVTVRRNPPRRARATPLITPFPNEEMLSHQPSQIPSTTSEKNENLKNPSENENLKVFLRIRPSQVQPPNQAPRVRTKTAWPKTQTKNIIATNNSKKKSSSSSCISINDSESVTLIVPSDLQDAKRVKLETYGGFTHVFPSNSSQVEVYDKMVKPMVDEFIKGKSGMLAALGPSGSGKTHTVFGIPRDPGMVPQVLRHIFKETEASRSFYIAIFEIYTERGKAEKLLDLLPDGGEISMQQSTIKGQKEVLISNAEQAETLIAQAVIKRATAMTNTNSQSSRSQCIINIRDVPKRCKGVVNSKSNDAVLTIIDLAGAEREKRTGNQGTRLVESNFINNTLMVFGLCLRSLLEHQKNPKKQLQKHFQNSMLTRYLRDYLEGKKRMTLLLTAKSGEDDYLDTSHLLRQASPYMQIKFNEVEPSNMVPKKRLHQASSIIDNAKQSPSLAHLKRMRLVGEHTVQNDEKGVEECNTLKKGTSTVCKLDVSSSVSLKSECDNHAGNERSHIIMRNFARVLWSVLKQYNSQLKVAEREILSLKESIGHEKEKNLELDMQLNEFRAACTCYKGRNEKSDTEDCSPVDLDHLHNFDQESFQETFDAVSSSEPRIDKSEEDHIPGKKSEREVSVSSSESRHHSALEIDDVSKETFNEESSSHPRDDEHILGTTCTEYSEKSDREVLVSLSNLWHHNALEVDAVSKIPSETIQTQLSSEPGIYLSNEEPMLVSPCKQLDSENLDREVSLSLSKPGHHNALEETFNAESSSEPRLDQLDAEHMICTACSELDYEKSDRKLSVSLSKPEHNAFVVDAIDRIPCETFLSDSSSQPTLEQLDEEYMPGSTCTVLDSKNSDREVSISSTKPGHDNSLEVDAVNRIPSETFPSQSSSSEEPMIGPSCTQLHAETSDSLVLVASASSSKPGDHKDLEVDAKSKMPRELLDSSLSTKNGILVPSSPKDVSSTKTRSDIGVNNSCKPPKPKRTLMPSSSMLSRNLSTFDFLDDSEKLKGNRGTRKLGARDDPKRSNGSISLLNLLQARKGNIRH